MPPLGMAPPFGKTMQGNGAAPLTPPGLMSAILSFGAMLLCIPALCVPVLCAPLLAQETITVAAASDLSFALPELASRFEQQTGNRVRWVLGSSGNLFTQIQNGAPYDVYLSADAAYPQKLLDSGRALAGSYSLYALGELVLFTGKNPALDLNKLGMNALTLSDKSRIAIANPAHAPYGRAALAALDYYNLRERVAKRLVIGENAAQAAQFVVSGNAQFALTARSVAQRQEGNFVSVPVLSYPPIQQAAVALRRNQQAGQRQAGQQQAALDFVRFLSGEDARGILRRNGFSLLTPGGAAPGRQQREPHP